MLSTAPKRFLSRSINLSEQIGLSLKSSPLAKHYLGRTAVDLILLPSDIRKIMTTYKSVFARHPNLITPSAFSEKLQRQKLLCRKHFHTLCADKLEVRSHVARTIGAEYLTNLVWHGDRLAEFKERSLLPERFIVKVNQGSGSNIICHNRHAFNWEHACAQTDAWLKYDYSMHFAEWQYRWIRPQVLIEELLLDESGKIPVDHRFFCFDGCVKMIQVDFDRETNLARLFFDENFRLLDVADDKPRYKGSPTRLKNLKLMLELAEKLAQGEEFVRIDLYDLGERVVFGEFTFHPSAGLKKFSPESFDAELGAKWVCRSSF